jgi:hypothetical protein
MLYWKDAMELKYLAELSRYPNCPPRSAKQRSRPAYRFVHEDIKDKRNFLPVIKLNPAREIPENMLCDCLALSMFESVDTAKKRFATLKKKVRNIHKTIGTHLATCNLVEEDGLSTVANDDGHFSLYESKSATAWETRFSVVGDLRGNG